MSMPPCLLDTDTLSEVIKARDPITLRRAVEYLAEHKFFQFSLITRYEILRGLKAKKATRQLAAFERQCQASRVLPVDNDVVVLAADFYALLRSRGQPVGDADLFIAATAHIHQLVLVTNNTAHFDRIPGLKLESWR